MVFLNNPLDINCKFTKEAPLVGKNQISGSNYHTNVNINPG